MKNVYEVPQAAMIRKNTPHSVKYQEYIKQMEPKCKSAIMPTKEVLNGNAL